MEKTTPSEKDANGEWITRVTMERGLLNVMTSVMPSMEGLFLVTVLDGRKGEAVVRYSPSVRSEMEQLFGYLKQRHGNGFQIIEDPSEWEATKAPTST